MSKGYHPDWRNFDPATRQTKAAAPATTLGDRGTRRGAKRVIVDKFHNIIDHATAKEQGIEGTFFQSRAEAKRFVALQSRADAGIIRNLRRQIKYPLVTRTPEGLIAIVCNYTADFVYEEPDGAGGWLEVVEDKKPSGGLREDVYLIKRKWFALQYGKEIRES